MSREPIEHTDVLIVGAGLSGIGAACQLRQECPDKSVVVLEARAALGGTWDLFRIPVSDRTPTCSRWVTDSGREPIPRRSLMGRASCATSTTPLGRLTCSGSFESITVWLKLIGTVTSHVGPSTCSVPTRMNW
jgi:choline dehydrogenase-like flavoprotein